MLNKGGSISSAGLMLSERRRKEAQRLSGVGFWELDHTKDHLYWSEEIYSIYEISEDIAPNYDLFLSLIHDDDRDVANAAYRDSVELRQEYNLRYRIKAADSIKWIEAKGVTYYDENGVPERSIGTAQDVSEIVAAQERIQHLAHHDGLTGLPSRRLFSERIDSARDLAERIGVNLVVLFIDIDNFKLINDRYGHETGDELLVAFAERLSKITRPNDTFARIGGDEFAGIMIDVDKSRLDSEIASLKRAIDGMYKTQVGRFDVTASIGVTVYPDDNEASDILLRHADQAMYEAKERGKSRVYFFDFDKHRSVQFRRQILTDLEVAIAEDQLTLYFQPRVSLRDGAPAGSEALLRWFRPDGLISPADVVGAIRGTHLEWALDSWVIETHFSYVRKFLDQGIKGPFSLNVCPSTIEDTNFPSLLSTMLDRSGVPGEEIEIEILEVSSIKNFELTDRILRKCKKLGVSFSLDDFGTGYSSLSHFHSLAVDKLKIDKGFIIGLESSDDNLMLVKSILAIAQTNKREVVAEGVESIAIASALAEMGCEYVQGFGIARPMSVNDYVAWAAAWNPEDFVNGVLDESRKSQRCPQCRPHPMPR